MIGFLKRLLGGGGEGRAGFRSYERQCIVWFVEQLPVEARTILNIQIEASPGGGRWDNDQIVDVALSSRKSQTPVFPNRGIDLCAGWVIVQDTAGEPIKCDFICHSGKLHRMVFGSPPAQRLEGEISLLGVEICEQLMSSDSRVRRPPAGPVQLPEKLKALPIEDLAAPPSQDVIEKFGKRFAPSLPEDYLELLRLTDGFTLNDWEVNGLRTWDVDYDEGLFSYLAEGLDLEEQDDCGLAVRHGDTAPKIWLHNKIGHSFTEMGNSFIDALVKVATD